MRKNYISRFRNWQVFSLISLSLIILANSLWLIQKNSPRPAQAKNNDQKIVIIHDGKHKQTVLTSVKTVSEVLSEAKIILNSADLVEPQLNETISDGFNINIFRARPLTIIDQHQKLAIMSSSFETREIIKRAGLDLQPEDQTTWQYDSLGLDTSLGQTIVIKRAQPINFKFFDKTTSIFTQAKTVADFLQDHQISLNHQQFVSPHPNTLITPNLVIKVWQEGQQETVVEESIAFTTKQIFNHDKPTGFKQVERAGKTGKQLTTYQLTIKNGQEIARTKLKTLVLEQPEEQVEIIGVNNAVRLNRSRGVNHFVDSNGIRHRETYYDLPMNIVMRNCGQGGKYTIRSDGVKIDADGYVLVAALLSKYPRCSIVETSLGPGKVYDTGTFTGVHPDGFDLATDWTKRDGI